MSYGDLPYMGRVGRFDLFIAKDGLPAPITGSPTCEKRTTWGYPSHTTDDGFLVYETLVVMFPGCDRDPKMVPRGYNTDCLLSNYGTVPLHHGVEADWVYRPNLYDLIMEPGLPEWNEPVVGWQQMGSQRELQYRQGLHETVLMKDAIIDARIDGDQQAEDIARANWIVGRWKEQKAITKADELLESMLRPTQLFELRTRYSFRCIGAATGKFYSVTPGNGFAEVAADTDQTTVSYCYHPDSYLPDGDVALAIKLHLEDGDLEEEFVAGANANSRTPKLAHRDSKARFDRAVAMERELLAA